MKLKQLKKIIKESIQQIVTEQNTTICQELAFQMQSIPGFGNASLQNIQSMCCPKCSTAQNDPNDNCYNFCNHDCCPGDDPCEELISNPAYPGCCEKCAANINVPSFQNDPCFQYCECCDGDPINDDPCSNAQTAHEECFWCPGQTHVNLPQPSNQCQTVGPNLNMALNNNISLYSDINDCTAAEAACIDNTSPTEQCHCCKKTGPNSWEQVSMLATVAQGECDSLNGYSNWGSPNPGFFNHCRPITQPLPKKCGKKPPIGPTGTSVLPSPKMAQIPGLKNIVREEIKNIQRKEKK
tara:strand:+ start:485 stop:1372 length:888 start_codon:yes stop_codon:yes gene_type:complete